MVEKNDRSVKRRHKVNPILWKPEDYKAYEKRQNELFENNYVNLKINKCIICKNEDVPNIEIDIPLFSETKTVLSLRVRGAECTKCQRQYFSKGSEIIIDRVKQTINEPLPRIIDTGDE